MAGVVLAWRRVAQDIDRILLTAGFLYGVEALESFGGTFMHCLAREKKIRRWPGDFCNTPAAF